MTSLDAAIINDWAQQNQIPLEVNRAPAADMWELRIWSGGAWKWVSLYGEQKCESKESKQPISQAIRTWLSTLHKNKD